MVEVADAKMFILKYENCRTLNIVELFARHRPYKILKELKILSLQLCIFIFFFFLFGRLKAARRQMRYWILVFWGEQKINQTFAQTKHSTDKSNEMHFSCVRAIFGSFFFSFNQTLKRSI